MSRAAKAGGVRRAAGTPSLRRDLAEDFARGRGSGRPDGDEEHYVPRRRFSGLRFRLKGGVPQSRTARVFATAVMLAGIVGFTAALWEMRSLLLHNQRLVIGSSADIQIMGNRHLSRPQLLSVFGEDVDRNILTVSLDERRAELERLPWVEHATVMRLLPNRFRVAITERTPVAFVRQGSSIGLVDANGVLLDMAADGEQTEETHYSFPVVTGVSRNEPLSTRAARMKLFRKFEAELDAGGQAISRNLSEVDISNPEDVKALIPAGKSDVLVHFGDTDFLHRYELFEKNLAGWQATYPRLASADMRYERQVVLEMAPGAAVPVPEHPAMIASAAVPQRPAARSVPARTPAKAAPARKAPVVTSRNLPPQPAPAPAASVPPGGHLQTSFAVSPRGKPHTTQEAPQ